jgi:hypothetical protein
MVDSIENLQRQFTDKYVVVDESIPELARFGGHVGQVKTINMNGRALVQFDAWNNIGWYDIQLDCLKVVPKPEPGAAEAKKADTKKEAPKPVAKAAGAAGDKKLSPLEMARAQGAAKPAGAAPAAGAKKSTSDILAAARGKAGAAPAADKPAVDKPAAAKPAAGGKLTPADLRAAARAKKAAEAEASSAAVEEPEAEPASTPEATAKPAKAAGGSSLPTGRRPTVAEIFAWCREHDAK